MNRYRFDDMDLADVSILPKSRALIYGSNPRDAISTVSTNNLLYLEQNPTSNFKYFGEYRIEPNGIDNNFPLNYKNLLDSVYIGHGVKRTLINLLLSGGVGLYKEVKEGFRIYMDWQIDNEIQDWLDSFDFVNEYLPEAATDMVYIENCFSALMLNKGARIGNPKISMLKHLNAEKVRLEYPDENGNRNFVYYSDWFYNDLRLEDIVPIPIFDKRYPFKHQKAAMFVKMPTFGSTSYGRPADIGATSLLKVLSLLPNFHQANLTEKGFKWIVSVAQNYYQVIREKNNWTEDSKEWKEWKTAFQERIDSFLLTTDADKVQTRIMTEFAIDKHTLQAVDSIRITKLDDDTKQLSEVGMSLHDTYTIGFVSASSIHPQLANVHLKNHALSGSNLREAYEMHVKVAAPMMRKLLLYPANTALKINFPSKNLKLGFMDVAFEEYTPVQSVKKSESEELKVKN